MYQFWSLAISSILKTQRPIIYRWKGNFPGFPLRVSMGYLDDENSFKNTKNRRQQSHSIDCSSSSIGGFASFFLHLPHLFAEQSFFFFSLVEFSIFADPSSSSFSLGAISLRLCLSLTNRSGYNKQSQKFTKVFSDNLLLKVSLAYCQLFERKGIFKANLKLMKWIVWRNFNLCIS